MKTWNCTILIVLGVFLAFAESVLAQPVPLRVRKSFSSLTDEELAAFKKGVEVMKSRPDDDPTSWQFQANMHGMLAQPTSELHRQCQHGTPYFFAWHRGYLCYFEKILRKASGDDKLTLPYWNWTEQTVLPSAFRTPANDSNPLYQSGRTLNDGSALPSQQLNFDLRRALGELDYWRFQQMIEGSPHGAVHVWVGGLMGGVPTSANDPIFWLHHGNVDRVWDLWLQSSSQRENPTNSQFLNQKFKYADENGQTVEVAVRDILSSSQLGYRYDDIPQPSEITTVAMESTNNDTIATSVSGFEAAGSKNLAFEDKKLNLSFSDGGKAKFEAATSADSKEKISVKITGIEFKERPVFTYGVYINLDEGENNQERSMQHYVGTINFFGADHAHGQGEATDKHKFDAILDVTGTIANLRSSGNWDPAKVSVTLRPIAPVAPKGKEEEKKQFYVESAKKAELTYEKVEVLTDR